jgi:hypothetical protein
MLASRSLCWVLSSGLLLACNGKVVDSPDDAGGGGAGSLDGSSGDASGGNTTAGTTGAGGAAGSNGFAGSSGARICPDCPAAPGVQLCCADFCGYLNTESLDCVPALAGSRIVPIVTAPQGELCATRSQCQSSDGCPMQVPAEGTACTGDLLCSYCAAPAIPRTVRCVAEAWVTVGPNPPCGDTIDPAR